MRRLGLTIATAASTGSAYPSTITPPEGTVTDVNVTFEFRHDFPDDLDIALVSPDGTVVTLMSDACGDDDSFHAFTFDDAANQMLQDDQDCDGRSPSTLRTSTGSMTTRIPAPRVRRKPSCPLTPADPPEGPGSSSAWTTATTTAG